MGLLTKLTIAEDKKTLLNPENNPVKVSKEIFPPAYVRMQFDPNEPWFNVGEKVGWSMTDLHPDRSEENVGYVMGEIEKVRERNTVNPDSFHDYWYFGVQFYVIEKGEPSSGSSTK